MMKWQKFCCVVVSMLRKFKDKIIVIMWCVVLCTLFIYADDKLWHWQRTNKVNKRPIDIFVASLCHDIRHCVFLNPQASKKLNNQNHTNWVLLCVEEMQLILNLPYTKKTDDDDRCSITKNDLKIKVNEFMHGFIYSKMAQFTTL